METELYRAPEDKLFRTISLSIEDTGELRMDGVDMGDLVEQWWGDYDYEYFVTIAAANKDKLLFNLLKDRYEGKASAVEDFKQYLEEREIPYDWMTWT